MTLGIIHTGDKICHTRLKSLGCAVVLVTQNEAQSQKTSGKGEVGGPKSSSRRGCCKGRGIGHGTRWVHAGGAARTRTE